MGIINMMCLDMSDFLLLRLLQIHNILFIVLIVVVMGY